MNTVSAQAAVAAKRGRSYAALIMKVLAEITATKKQREDSSTTQFIWELYSNVSGRPEFPGVVMCLELAPIALGYVAEMIALAKAMKK